MTTILSGLRRLAEGFAALMMALMFLTFILQIFVRYSAKLEWLPARLPFLEPSLYGWTLEFCLLLWIWLVFWGNAFIVRDRDHVTFDILYNYVGPSVRRWFAIVAGVAIAVGLASSLEPTWSKFHILRLKKTATLSNVFGDWVRMRHIYSVYALFLIAVSLRYAWAVYSAFRYGVDELDVPSPEPDHS